MLLYTLYNGILLPPRLATAPIGAWLDRQGGPKAGEWAQRLGFVNGRAQVWMQAASVGEVGIARRLVAALAARHPDLTLALTTTTRTGQALARSLAEGGFGGIQPQCSFFPVDLTGAVRRALDRIRPRLFIMIETEIWPNLLRECSRRDTRTLIVNGRISRRSHARYRLVRPLMRSALAFVDLACVQTREDAARFASLGLPEERIRISGNIKYDLPPPPSPGEAGKLRSGLGLPPGDPVLVAGSTAEGEDALVLEAFRRVRERHPAARLILVPRHPERFDSAAGLAAAAGYTVTRRTGGLIRATGEPAPDVVILDTIGELMLAYAAADAAFVGGSLVPAGGQNMIEPASCGLAPVFGPHTDNFAEPSGRLLGAGCARRVRTPGELAEAWIETIDDPEAARARGRLARQAVSEVSGATQRAVDAVSELLSAPRAGHRPNDGGGE